MQVKKFEARTMKEALEMVKTQLGPDAIILSARDNNKSFGLVGEGSVEITAAVSEETLQKKKFAEARLREQDREKFLKSPARQQKELITKMVDRHTEKNKVPPPITKTRYIDIDEPETSQNRSLRDERGQVTAQKSLQSFQTQEQSFGQNRNLVANKNASGNYARVPQQAVASGAASSVANNYTGVTNGTLASSSAAHSNSANSLVAMGHQMGTQMGSTAASAQAESEAIRVLKNEIESLKKVISHFQQMPPNFVGGHPGADYGIQYDLSSVFQKLIASGVAPDITADLLTRAQETFPAMKLKNKALVEAWIARQVLDSTKIVLSPSQGKIHCFVGPAGSGKTSAMIKMASHLVVKEHKKVALLTTDTYKVGAADQMKIYSQILNVPFAVIRTQHDWQHLMKYLVNVDSVLVDCAGLSLKSSEEVQMMRNLLPPQVLSPNIHLVLSANTKDNDAMELGRRYSALGYKDVIFTGLDESTQHGTIYNFMKRFDIPLHSFGIGTRVPEDFEFASKERLLDLIFKITQIRQQEATAI